MKKIGFLGVRLPPEVKAAAEAQAAKQGITLSELIRRRLATDPPTDPSNLSPSTTLPRFRDEDIGPDPLWSGEKALVR